MKRSILTAAVLLITGVTGGCVSVYHGSSTAAETYVAAEVTESAAVNDSSAAPAPQTQPSALTLDQAKQKVAERIQGVDINSIYIKQDYDDGRLEYEGEVYFNQKKYEFTLDAATGNFTDWEEEW